MKFGATFGGWGSGSGLRNDVGMACYLLPAAGLLHPNGGKAKFFGFASVGHFTAPDDGFTAGENHGVPMNSCVLDPSVIRSDNQKADSAMPRTCCLFTNL